ncbi:hypothetical protein HEP87_57225 [Streptomyces sp. S1D4-11]
MDGPAVSAVACVDGGDGDVGAGFGLYAEAAIPHFWRLEFDPAPRLIVNELHAGR